MQVFSFAYAGREFVVAVAPATGEEWVRVDDEVVSHVRNFNPASDHYFDLSELGQVRIGFQLKLSIAQAAYQLWVDGVQVLGAEAALIIHDEALAETQNETAVADQSIKADPVKSNSWISIGLVVLKLLKSVQVVKVALLAASAAVYSVIFTIEFALALIGVLVFHEYGHVRAMKKFGIPTKGIYLIPFLGGLAVGDQPQTRWQNIYISMMGPVFGLALSAVFYIIYLVTGSHFAGLVASISALLNLVNMIPVHPLDGGQVIKSLVFSGRNYWALVALLTISAGCFVLAWNAGFYFLMVFIAIGVIDILASWRIGLAQDITPLNLYGIWFCVFWYLGVVALLLGMIMLVAADKLPGSEIAMKVLSS